MLIKFYRLKGFCSRCCVGFSAVSETKKVYCPMCKSNQITKTILGEVWGDELERCKRSRYSKPKS